MGLRWGAGVLLLVESHMGKSLKVYLARLGPFIRSHEVGCRQWHVSSILA
jgi:hypothetical protein